MSAQRGCSVSDLVCVVVLVLLADSARGQSFSWNAASGALMVEPIADFYSCSLEEDMTVYPDEGACRAMCQAGSCVQQFDRVQLVDKMGAMETKMVDPGLRVHETLEIAVEASMVQVSFEPGLPIGMTAEADGADKLTLSWTPQVGQQGYLHEVVLVSGAAGSETMLKIQVPVLPEATHWVSPAEGASLEATVGLPAHVTFTCVSNYAIEVTWGPLPPGMAVRMAPPQRTITDGAASPSAPVSGVLDFTAGHGQEGRSWDVCFACQSTVLRAPQHRCVHVSVALCRYSTQPGDSLLSLTRAFHHSNNWRRLWNANAGLVADPERVLAHGTVLAVGPRYTVQAGDSLASVAGRFDTTVRNLLAMNPFIADEQLVMAGAELCVTACTSKPNPSLDDRFSY
eukprot:CAMPEP_0196731140 /NCGR_PEP_ID=MMETSP1091-20130531/10984_1 /TAXON_ID=302021 /ORGANISM="Rhodomonas sp., Strain CCMP768" /LENGTH=397 /DNA_ID=CAMNT_0042074251 /DNA_START=178 /DNA_END=1371 /DNA_ORIENTATION=-